MKFRINNTAPTMAFRVNGFQSVEIIPASRGSPPPSYTVPAPSALSAAAVQGIVDDRLAVINSNPSQNPLLIVTTTLDF